MPDHHHWTIVREIVEEPGVKPLDGLTLPATELAAMLAMRTLQPGSIVRSPDGREFEVFVVHRPGRKPVYAIRCGDEVLADVYAACVLRPFEVPAEV